MKNKKGSKAKKTRTATKTKRAKAPKKVGPPKRRIHVIPQLANPEIRDSGRVKESIGNYHKGDTIGFSSVDEIWEFAESDQ
jgi:hypothetical protein